MFYDEFIKMCSLKGVSRTKACTDCGVSRTAWHKWQSGATPNGATLDKLADYFGVTTGYLLGKEYPKKEAPALTEKDERDISKKLEETLNQLESSQDGLMFDGEPMDDITRELLLTSLRNSMEMGKKIAKQKYTPKKYR